MQQTTNFKLNKPDYTDTADIADINSNMDIIDKNLGQITIPTYTDSKGNKYIDIDGMHLRLDNSAYIKGGIKIVNKDPCKDGTNITEDMVTGEKTTLYVVAKIDENGDAVFNEIDADSIDADDISGDILRISGIRLNEDGLHFNRAKGAVYNDNSKNTSSDGSRKLLIGTYRDTPSVDINNIPKALPNAGIRFRVESDENGNDTYAELYGANIICRTDNALFKAGTVKADTIRANTKLQIDGQSVAEMINAKADSSHTHTLDDVTETTEKKILTAAERTKLSNIATGANKTVVDTALSATSTNPVQNKVIYNAMQNLNSRTHIVVASYDTKNPLKGNADYTCTAANASSVLKTAISAVADGGKIELLDGSYYLQYSEGTIEITKQIAIEGSGYKTTIHQPVDTGAGEAKAIFTLNAENIKIKNMMICDANISSPVSMILQNKQGAVYDGIFFIFNGSESSCDNSCIEGSGDCQYTRIQNCRVYKGFSNEDKIMFDFRECTGFGGVIGGNISSGYDNISIGFNSTSHQNNTAVYGQVNTQVVFKS